MATVFVTPNMGLPSPIPTETPGPEWAQDNYNCLAQIDAHTHAPGSGVQITPSGLNISSDLTFLGNNATAIRSVRFSPQGAPIGTAADVGCLYEAGVDLYYNDGSGNQIRITQGGTVAGAAGTITGLPSGTASAAFVAATGSFVFQQATSTAANLDVGSVAIRYPGSYPTPAGNYIQLQAPASLASGYSITLPAAAPGATLPLSMSSGGIVSAAQIGTAQIANSAITTVLLAPSAVTGAKIDAATIDISNMAANSVGTAQIVNSNVTSAKIQNNVNLPGTQTQSNSKNLIVSSAPAATSTNLATIRIRSSSGGSVIAGEGVSSIGNPSTGRYQVNFTTPFNASDIPVAVASANSGFVASTANFANTSVDVFVRTNAGVLTNETFTLIVFGAT